MADEEIIDSVQNTPLPVQPSLQVQPKVYVPNLSGSLTITSERLIGSQNYQDWASAVELWFMGQGVVDHLTTTSEEIQHEKDIWKRVDAQLCSLLWQSLAPDLIPMFRPFRTCFSVWKQAQSLYTNDISRFYFIVSEILSVKKSEMSMEKFLGKIQGLMAEFNKLMPIGGSPEEQLTQRDKFFVVLTLAKLEPEFEQVRNSILGDGAVPNTKEMFKRLLQVSSIHRGNTSTLVDHSALTTQSYNRGRGRGSNRGGRGGGRNSTRFCDFCNKQGHTREVCWKLHGKPTMVNIAQSANSDTQVISKDEYAEFLQLKAAKTTISPDSTHIALASQSNSVWFLDSGATDHISGNPSFFSKIDFSDSLPSVTFGDGSKGKAKGIGKVTIHSFSLEHVLYIPGCPFNLISIHQLTHSLNCLVTFSSDSVVIQDRQTREMLGTGHESQGLYHLLGSTNTSTACAATVSPLLSHCRLGHPNINKLKQLVPGLSDLKNIECESCQLGKHSRASYPSRVNRRASTPFSLVHSDVWGPCRVSTTLGFLYFVVFIDDFSRCSWVFLMKNRFELFDVFKTFYNEVLNQFGVSLKVLRSDNAREYFSDSFTSFFSTHGILHESSCARTPQQNGVAERKIRHLVDTARTLLIHHKVPKRFWGDAILHSCHLINRMPSSVLQGKIPLNLLLPQEPLHKLPLRVFGCTCFVHDSTPGRDKLDAKAIKCVFIGYSRLQKGFRCYCPKTHRFYTSFDVTFFETTPFFSSTPVDESDFLWEPLEATEILPVPNFTEPVSPNVAETTAPMSTIQERRNSPFLYTYQRRNRQGSQEDECLVDSCPTPALPTDTAQNIITDSPIASRVGNRSTRNPYPIYNFLSHKRLSPSYCAFITSLSTVFVPNNVKEALTHPGWTQAMVDEMEALHSSGTWELVPLPPGKSVVGCRWVYNVKVGPDGQIDRLKARLVAKGYTQVFGIDYTDTFSPVAKITSIRLLFSIAANRHWPLYQLDIKNAFLHGDLNEEVYMEQPPGFVAKTGANLVCRLKRSLYGLKQSPRAWFGRFRDVVQRFGMIQSKADHSVFYKHTLGQSIYLVVYVDDIVITGNDSEGINQLKKHLFQHFETKDLGKLKYFLGIEVAQSEQGIYVSQRKYVLDILEETGMTSCKPIDTPMDPNVKLLPRQGELLSDPSKYRRLVDYLVDESTECNSTSDILLERNREQSLIDLLIPSLVLLINLLQKLQEAKEQHRNTKLINSLVQLHREVSPKLAACSADLSCPCPKLALGLGAVCHLLASALACWSVYGWTPGLFHFLLDSLNATSVVALGPKETCSLLCLLNDLFPDERVWLWKDGTPMLATLRALAVRTLLGPQKEEEVNWYLQPGHSEKLLAQLTPQLGKIAQIILHCCVSTLIVVQDMLRVFITRIAYLSTDNASVLVRPIILKIHDHLSDHSILSEVDTYKVHHLLAFLSLLLEHPQAKKIMLKDGAVQMLSEVLQKCLAVVSLDPKVFLENRNVSGKVTSVVSWCIPVFKSISLICDSRTHGQSISVPDRHISETFTAKECILVLTYLLTFCKILPVGKELIACLSAFKELCCSARGKSSLLSICQHILLSNEDRESESQFANIHDIINTFDWKDYPPLEYCWRLVLSSVASKNVPLAYTVEAIGTLSLGSLYFCMDADSVNLERVEAMQYLVGFKNGSSPPVLCEESMKSFENYTSLFGSMGNDDMYSVGFDKAYLDHVKELARSLMLLLHEPTGTVKANEIASILSTSPIDTTVCSKIHKLVDGSVGRIEDDSLDEHGDNFLWECPENLRDRLTQTGLASKRKISSMEGSNRRARGDASSAETAAPGAFSRGSVPPVVVSGPTRRDTFRQRKPNTSRPPSMHVDDYVARERNADGSNNSNVIAVPRIGSSSGRPPSIHVDEFMARQRERQNSVGLPVTDVAAAQEKLAPVENKADVEKSTMPRQLKPVLDDDLQGIEIVFDAEEAEPDDKLPFPQPDDHLQQPGSVIVDQNSPRSIVEETVSEVNETRQFSRVGTSRVSNPADENTHSEFSSSRMSVSRPEMALTREPSVSSDRKFSDQSEEPRSSTVKTSNGFDSLGKAVSTGAFPKASASPLQTTVDSHSPANIYTRTTGGQNPAIASQGYYDQKSQPPSQAPLPLMPPLATTSPVFSNPADHTVQPDYLSARNSTSASTTSSPLPDSKYGRTTLSSAGGSTRPFPPLPPTPPPFAVPTSFSSLKPSASQSPVYNQNVSGTTELHQTSASDARLANLAASGPILTTFSPPPLAPPLLFSRPSSIPVNPYGSNSAPHHIESLPSNAQNLPASLPSIHSLPSIAQLQPLQPPQLPRPPSQHLRPFIPGSLQSDQGVSLLQSRMHMQMQPLQMLHQPQLSPGHVYYQTPQPQENISHSLQQQQQQQQLQQQQQQQQHDHLLPQGSRQQGDSQQQDSGMSLQDFFRSPEAIQSLLSDRDKLCQLLEQHPKLMQMLQDRLGQL